MGLYKQVRPDGSVVYTDVPQGDGDVRQLGRDGRERPPAHVSHKEIEGVIKEVRKRIPKINDYLEYLEYLRSHSALKFDRVMRELQKEDPGAWVKLQKYPQFQPLREAALGQKVAGKHIGALTFVANGKYGGAVDYWLETTVKDMMKRDRWGPYADVLGAKATTLPPPKPPTYSNTRLGQHMKVEDARLARALKESAKELEASRAAVRTAKAAAATRSLNPLLDVGIGALNPEVGTGVRDGLVLGPKIKRLYQAGVLDEMQWEEAQRLLSQGNVAELDQLLTQATARFIRAEP